MYITFGIPAPLPKSERYIGERAYINHAPTFEKVLVEIWDGSESELTPEDVQSDSKLLKTSATTPSQQLGVSRSRKPH